MLGPKNICSSTLPARSNRQASRRPVTCSALPLREWQRKDRTSADIAREPLSKLRLFLDTASLTQLELWFSTGLFHGLTCNPIILKRDGVKCNLKGLSQLAKAGFDLGFQEVHMQAWGASVPKMTSVAYDLAGIDPARVVVKLPCTLEGVQTAALLRESNVRVNLTGLYAAPQVMLAQGVGAEYAAPYLGRMNDAYGGEQGLAQVTDMLRALEGCGSRCRLMVASVRDPVELTRLAAVGADTFTISPTIASKLFTNPYTIDAAAEFAAAAMSNGADEEAGTTPSIPLGSVTARSATQPAQHS